MLCQRGNAVEQTRCKRENGADFASPSIQSGEAATDLIHAPGGGQAPILLGYDIFGRIQEHMKDSSLQPRQRALEAGAVSVQHTHRNPSAAWGILRYLVAAL